MSLFFKNFTQVLDESFASQSQVIFQSIYFHFLDFCSHKVLIEFILCADWALRIYNTCLFYGFFLFSISSQKNSCSDLYITNPVFFRGYSFFTLYWILYFDNYVFHLKAPFMNLTLFLLHECIFPCFFPSFFLFWESIQKFTILTISKSTVQWY